SSGPSDQIAEPTHHRVCLEVLDREPRLLDELSGLQGLVGPPRPADRGHQRDSHRDGDDLRARAPCRRSDPSRDHREPPFRMSGEVRDGDGKSIRVFPLPRAGSARRPRPERSSGDAGSRTKDSRVEESVTYRRGAPAPGHLDEAWTRRTNRLVWVKPTSRGARDRISAPPNRVSSSMGASVNAPSRRTTGQRSTAARQPGRGHPILTGVPVMPSGDPLLQPFALRHLTLRNRVLSTAHEPAYSDGGMPKARYRRYHEERAKGGIALTMTAGSAIVAPDSPAVFGNLHLYDDGIVPWLTELTDA